MIEPNTGSSVTIQLYFTFFSVTLFRNSSTLGLSLCDVFHAPIQSMLDDAMIIFMKRSRAK